MEDDAAIISNNSVPVIGRRRRAAAVALYATAWMILGSILVASVIKISRWEVAPGEAMPVGSRIEFVATDGDVPERFTPENRIRFVTAFTGKMTALDAFLGWLDPDVQVDTYEEHFGTSDPSTVKVTGSLAMYSAQQLAMYVALTYLGIGEPKFLEGDPVISKLLCEKEPTDDSGCKVLEVGDAITAVDGVEVGSPTELRDALAGRTVGSVVTVLVRPSGSTTDVEREVRMIANPDRPDRALLGVVLADTRRVSLPFEVKISTGAIGGPSAGLAFTLALIDELTPGDLLGDVGVAATGTIDEEGNVGAIGALPQKAVAVRQSGARLFLVPTGQSRDEVEKARRATDGEVRIIQVATLTEALKVLIDNGGDPVRRAG